MGLSLFVLWALSKSPPQRLHLFAHFWTPQLESNYLNQCYYFQHFPLHYPWNPPTILWDKGAGKTAELKKLVKFRACDYKLQLALKWMSFLANKYRSHRNCCFEFRQNVWSHRVIAALKWHVLHSIPNPSLFPFLVKISYSQINLLFSLGEVPIHSSALIRTIDKFIYTFHTPFFTIVTPPIFLACYKNTLLTKKYSLKNIYSLIKVGSSFNGEILFIALFLRQCVTM